MGVCYCSMFCYTLLYVHSSIAIILMGKRNKLYLRAHKSKDPDVKIHYKWFRTHVQKVLRDAYWKYVSNIFTFEKDSSDPDTPKPEKIKKFGHLSNLLKKDAFGSTSLRENGIFKTDAEKKVKICNRQFHSAFTPKGDADPPSKGASPFSSMGDITIDQKGVAKPLDGLNVHKAPGTDGLNAGVLKECSNEISPILALIFNEALAQGDVPYEWRQANVSPVFRKGEIYDAANFRLVSLTCICCKTLEHILVSNISKQPVCASYHQQPGWGCRSWTVTDRFDHNGFRKGL